MARVGERGSVTAELALVLPAVVLVLVVVLTAAGAGIVQLRVADAARAGARAAALGEASEVVHATVRHLAGDDARISVATANGFVVVTVTEELPGIPGLAGLRAASTARSVPEPG